MTAFIEFFAFNNPNILEIMNKWPLSQININVDS